MTPEEIAQLVKVFIEQNPEPSGFGQWGPYVGAILVMFFTYMTRQEKKMENWFTEISSLFEQQIALAREDNKQRDQWFRELIDKLTNGKDE